MRRHPPKLTARLAVVGLTGFAAAACLGAPRPSGDVQATATPGAVTVDVATAPGTEQRFVPSQVTVPPGAAIRLVFRNQSTESHNLSFTGSLEPIHTRTIVEPGQDEAVTFVAPTAGVYPFVCTVHIGMAGELRVSAGRAHP